MHLDTSALTVVPGGVRVSLRSYAISQDALVLGTALGGPLGALAIVVVGEILSESFGAGVGPWLDWAAPWLAALGLAATPMILVALVAARRARTTIELASGRVTATWRPPLGLRRRSTTGAPSQLTVRDGKLRLAGVAVPVGGEPVWVREAVATLLPALVEDPVGKWEALRRSCPTPSPERVRDAVVALGESAKVDHDGFETSLVRVGGSRDQLEATAAALLWPLIPASAWVVAWDQVGRGFGLSHRREFQALAASAGALIGLTLATWSILRRWLAPSTLVRVDGNRLEVRRGARPLQSWPLADVAWVGAGTELTLRTRDDRDHVLHEGGARPERIKAVAEAVSVAMFRARAGLPPAEPAELAALRTRERARTVAQPEA